MSLILYLCALCARKLLQSEQGRSVSATRSWNVATPRGAQRFVSANMSYAWATRVTECRDYGLPFNEMQTRLCFDDLRNLPGLEGKGSLLKFCLHIALAEETAVILSACLTRVTSGCLEAVVHHSTNTASNRGDEKDSQITTLSSRGAVAFSDGKIAQTRLTIPDLALVAADDFPGVFLGASDLRLTP